MSEPSRIAAQAQKKSSKPYAVVVNTGDANSYGVISNLGSENVPVISVSHDEKNLTFHSRYAIKALCPNLFTAEDEFIDYLEALGKALTRKAVLFTNGDELLLVLLRHRERLENCFHMPFAPYALARQLTEKAAFYQLLEQQAAPHARTHRPRPPHDLNNFAQQIAYPCIVKPSQSQTFSSRFGNKCLRVDSAEELLDLYPKVVESEPEIIVQELLEGTERYLVYNYFSQQGEHKAISSYRKQRILPIDFGNATACRSIVDEELESLVTDLLKAINYRGLAEAEVQRDARDGKLKVVEINTRTTTQSRLSAACGVNMELIAYRDMLGEAQSFLANRRPGVLWVDLYRDVLAVFSADGYRAKTGLRAADWLQSLRRPRVFAFCSLRDPLPTLVLLGRVLRSHLLNRQRMTSFTRLPLRLLRKQG